MNPQLSVVIVNFNTLELTRNCIQSVLDSSRSIDLEIIVVDNASKSSPATLLKEFAGIKLIENSTNIESRLFTYSFTARNLEQRIYIKPGVGQ